jgi:hypothetical protein
MSRKKVAAATFFTTDVLSRFAMLFEELAEQTIGVQLPQSGDSQFGPAATDQMPGQRAPTLHWQLS